MKKKHIFNVIVLLSALSATLATVAKENASISGEFSYLVANSKNFELAQNVEEVNSNNAELVLLTEETVEVQQESTKTIETESFTESEQIEDNLPQDSDVYVNSVEELEDSLMEEVLPEKKLKSSFWTNMSSKTKNFKNPFKRNKNKTKSKKNTREKGTFTDFTKTANVKNIENEISKEEIFQKTTNNKIYLNRFKAFDSEDKEKSFYNLKDIVETEDGDLQLSPSNGREIDKLIEEIENSNVDDENSKVIDLSLRDCLAIALAKHPDVLSAKLETDINKSRILQAWAGYFPNFSAGFNYGYDWMKEPNYKYHYNSAYFPTVSAGMLLFDFGKVKTDVDMATSSYDASRYNLQDSINLIIYSVKSAYYNMLFAQKQVEIYEKTIEDYELQLRSARKYFSIGKKPQIEVAMAEYNEGNARLNLVKARNALENAKVLLANTLGLPEFANFELVSNLHSQNSTGDLEAFLTDAFSIRPDLLSYEKNVEYAYLALRRAKRSFAPDLVGNGGVTHGGADPMKSTTYRISVDLSYSGFNMLQLKKEYDIALKTYEKSLVDYESFRNNVYLEVKQAYIDLINSKESVEQAELNVKQAKAQHYHATGRYNAGVSDAIEMKDAENTFLSAQLEYYQALLDYNLAIAGLEKVIGRPVEVQDQCL